MENRDKNITKLKPCTNDIKEVLVRRRPLLNYLEIFMKCTTSKFHLKVLLSLVLINA